MNTTRTITANGNPFAEDVTVAPAAPHYEWRTDADYDTVEVQVERYSFRLDREQAMQLAIALLNAANHDEHAADTEEDYCAALIARHEEELDAKYDALSAHWGHD